MSLLIVIPMSQEGGRERELVSRIVVVTAVSYERYPNESGRGEGT
jgi:hypothetical protein